MLNTIRQTIQQYNMLSPGDGVVVGLSGGADSVALLAVLLALKKELQLSVYATHLNHNLRGDAAKHDEDFVRKLCKDTGIPLLVFSADVQKYAALEKQSIEEAGRNLRYKYLRQGLANFNAQKIAVGHHADDNAETILLNLFRGTGLKGLCGIPPVNGEIIRPLLEVSRKSIEAYAHENGLPFITDESNTISDYRRNYVRNEIIPHVRKQFGEGVTETMARNALWLRADEEYLADMASRSMPTDLSSLNEIVLPIQKLLSQPTALIRRMLRHAICNLRGELALEDIQSAHITAILDIAQGHSGRMADLPGFKAKREYENLVLYIPGQTGYTGSTARINTPPTHISYPLLPENPIHIPPITVTLSLAPPKKHEKSHNSCTRAFNCDKFSNVLELRVRCPGDKINLEGTGTKKIQDYFTDTKTPRSQRDQILLLADGSNIIWIMDKHNRTSAAYQPTQGQSTCWITVHTKEGIEQ